jgi:GNAT superfamily N-acetyltransferase
MFHEAIDAAAVSLCAVRAEDAEELVAVRIEAMRESLERIGRFDAERARGRFLSSFVPECTRHIVVGAQRVGFVVVKPIPDGLNLEHLYLCPDHQGRGIGSAVLMLIFEEADSQRLPLRVGALRGSASNRFYLRHGFRLVAEGEWDIYYVRPASPARPICGPPNQ